MPYFEIPLRSDVYSYTQKVTISNVVYTLRLKYNLRMDRWVLDLATDDGTDILIGLPLLPGPPITYRFIDRKANVPEGQFLIVDETEADRTPTKDTLGEDIKLIYVE